MVGYLDKSRRDPEAPLQQRTGKARGRLEDRQPVKVSRQKHGDFLPAAEPADQDRTGGRLPSDVATRRARLPRHDQDRTGGRVPGDVATLRAPPPPRMLL